MTPPASSSIPVRAIERQIVRRRQPPLIATRLVSACTLSLADGRVVFASAGDWQIGHGTQTVDVVSDLTPHYEPIIETQLTLSKPDCDALDDTLGLGATHSPASLRTAVERLASIKIGDIRIPFTPGQLIELQHRAAKRRRTVEAEIRAVVSRIEDELFWKGG